MTKPPNGNRKKAVTGVAFAMCLLASMLVVSNLQNSEPNAHVAGAQGFTSFYSTMGVDLEHHELKQSNYSASGLPKELVRNLIALGQKRKTMDKSVRTSMRQHARLISRILHCFS